MLYGVLPPSSPRCRCAALHAVHACAHLYSSRATHACVKGCNSPVRAIRNCVLVAHGRFAIFERSRSDAANASATAIATTGECRAKACDDTPKSGHCTFTTSKTALQ
jgi:hypothetical protein